MERFERIYMFFLMQFCFFTLSSIISFFIIFYANVVLELFVSLFTDILEIVIQLFLVPITRITDFFAAFYWVEFLSIVNDFFYVSLSVILFFLLFITFFSFFLSLPNFRKVILFFYVFCLFIIIGWFFYLNDFSLLFGIFFYVYKFKFFGLYVSLTLNFFSLFFIFLTFILAFCCSLVIWNVRFRAKYLILMLYIITCLLFLSFIVDDLLLFYICFEALVIPMFLLIGVWGSRERKIKAAYQFFLYTIFGSLSLLTAVFFVYSGCGSTDVNIYSGCYFSEVRQLLCWVLFFIGVSLKVPVIPLHLWLPEAHVEAPTVGSIILAGVLLKLGLFALIKFSYPIFYIGNEYFGSFAVTISCLSVLYASLSTLIQIDMKKLVAYSSVAHMNFCVLGLFTNLGIGWVGSFLMMLSHGFVSSALFFCIGVLYDRYKTRSFLYYGGLLRFMPLFSFSFFIMVLANMGFPGTFNFISEVLVLFSVVSYDLVLSVLIGSSMVFSAAYCLSLYTNLMLLEVNGFFVKSYADLSRREFFVVFLLLVLTILFGLFPNLIILPIDLNLIVYSDVTRLILH